MWSMGRLLYLNNAMQPDRTLNYYLQVALRRLDLGEVADEMRVERYYRQTVGDLISRLTSSVHYTHGTLYLRLLSAPLRHELIMRREGLRTRLNDLLGAEAVKEIIIR